MKKILIIFTFAVIYTSVFGEITWNNDFLESGLQNSAVYQATAGEFSSDSDNVNSKDIFNLQRTFLSAGYVPSVLGGGQIMQAFWGMPIGNMYIAIAGAYEASNSRNDAFSGGIQTGTGNDITGTTALTAAGNIMFRPVFKLNDSLSFHYYLTRVGTRTKTTVTTVQDVISPMVNKTVTTNIDSGSAWSHEVAATIKFGEMYIYIPLEVSINNNLTGASNKYSYSQIINGENKTTTVVKTNDFSVILGLNPEFWFPLVAGPMTGIMFKAGVNVAIYENINSFETNTWEGMGAIWDVALGNGREKVITERKYKGLHNVAFKVAVNPSFSWSLAKDIVELNMDPEIGVEFLSQSGGYSELDKVTTTYAGGATTDGVIPNTTAKTSTTTVTPYIEVPIGTIVSPKEWFEIRAGLFYRLDIDMTTTAYDNTVTALQGGKRSEYSYNLNSLMGVYAGMGFIIAEDFFIDLYLTASGTTTPTANSLNLFNLQAWGMQLSYRF